MNKVIRLGMLFNEGDVPDFGSIVEDIHQRGLYYLLAKDIPKLNTMLTRAAAENYLIGNETFNFFSGYMAYVIDHKEAGTGEIYAYHRGKDRWYEFNIRLDKSFNEIMWERHKKILRETKTISGTAPLTFKSNGRPLKNYRIYGNTVNGESVGDLITEGEYAGEYCVPITISRKAKHTATLQLHDCLSAVIQFDAAEALYYAENGLAAGTYCFTIQAGYEETYGGGKTYNFTITQNVPVGGQLTFTWSNNTQAINAKIISYANSASTTSIEEVSVTEGSAGTNLGTTDGSITNVNHIQKVRYGSNNYSESAIRQYLNSSASEGNVWSPKSKFDRPPVWNNTTAGFMKDIDAAFLASVGITHNVNSLNMPIYGGGSIILDDFFFLISRSEVYGGLENNTNEGNPYSYYSDYSDLSEEGYGDDTNRIKYRNGNTQTWWLRSPYSTTGNFVDSISRTGDIVGSNSYGSFGIAPACNIELDENYQYKGKVLQVRDQITVTKGNKTLVFDVISIDHDDVDFDTVTTNILLPSQLTSFGDDSDYIDFKTQKLFYIDGTTADITFPILPTFSGKNILLAGTNVQPSKAEIYGIISTAQ